MRYKVLFKNGHTLILNNNEGNALLTAFNKNVQEEHMFHSNGINVTEYYNMREVVYIRPIPDTEEAKVL